MEIRLDGNLHGFRTRLRRSRRLRQYTLRAFFVDSASVYIGQGAKMRSGTPGENKEITEASCLCLLKDENRSIPSGFLHIGSIFAGSTRANHRRLMEIRLDGNLHGFRTRLRRSRRQNAVRNARRKQTERRHTVYTPYGAVPSFVAFVFLTYTYRIPRRRTYRACLRRYISSASSTCP